MLQVQKSDLAQGKGTKTGLPEPLVGGMRLNSVEMPVCAAGRLQNDPVAVVELSYPAARGCARLLNGELGDVELVGSASDTSASGVHFVLSNGKSQAWVVMEDSPTGKGKVLKLCGMPFSSQLVNYNAGVALGLFMLLRRDIYSDFKSAVLNAVEAWQDTNQTRRAQALALMADELSFAVELMIAGGDPLDIQAVLLDRAKPENLDKVFDGGNQLKTAFTDIYTLKGLDVTNGPITHVKADTQSCPVSFIGNLPDKLRDCILRGKHVLLTGPTATGKTLAVEEACIALGAPLTITKGSEGLEDRDLIASVSLVAGDTVTRYGPIPEAMVTGKRQHEMHLQEAEHAKREGRDPVPVPPAVLLIDEINRLQTRHQNFLVSMLNVRKATQDYYLRIPDSNEEITCPDGFFVVIAARNIGSAFAGTNTMDLALERRFYKKIDLQYLPPEQEAALVQSRTRLDDNLSRVLVKVAQDTRFQLSQLKAPLDTDTLLKWAEELAWLRLNGATVTDQLVLETARDVVFDIVLERSERGGFDPAGEAVLTDNISENWRDAFMAQST